MQYCTVGVELGVCLYSREYVRSGHAEDQLANEVNDEDNKRAEHCEREPAAGHNGRDASARFPAHRAYKRHLTIKHSLSLFFLSFSFLSFIH